MQTAADYRSSNAESGRGDGNTPRFPEVCVRRLNERVKQMLEIGEILGGMAGLKYRPQVCAPLLEYSAVSLCTAAVAPPKHLGPTYFFPPNKLKTFYAL